MEGKGVDANEVNDELFAETMKDCDFCFISPSPLFLPHLMNRNNAYIYIACRTHTHTAIQKEKNISTPALTFNKCYAPPNLCPRPCGDGSLGRGAWGYLRRIGHPANGQQVPLRTRRLHLLPTIMPKMADSGHK